MKYLHRIARLRRARWSICLGSMLLAGAMAYAATEPAAPATPAATTPAAATGGPLSAASLRPMLPLEFSKFAPDYQAKFITPPWMVLQIGTMETYYSPPEGRNAFIMPEDKLGRFAEELKTKFRPIELSCLMGAKAKFENVTLLDLDKAGNPLGYTLPLGQTIYFVARGETEQGIIYSVHYFDSGTALNWIINPDKDGAYIPVIQPTSVTQDLGAPEGSYAFLYLSRRVGTARPDSTAMPLTLYTYLVIRIHKIPAPAAPTGLAGGR